MAASEWSKWTQNKNKKHMDTERKLFIQNIFRSSKQERRISIKRKAKSPKSNLDKGERDAVK